MFFPRVDMKHFAKSRVQENRWPAVGVAAIALLLGALGETVSGIDVEFRLGSWEETTVADVPIKELVSAEWLPLVVVIALVVALIVFGVTVFVSNVVMVGVRGWFLRYQRGEVAPVGEMFASFRIYGVSLTTMLLRSVYTYLWTLLLVIPGVVKSYAYSMAEYIIYENPRISASQALNLSAKLTDGYKGKLFLLDLSWIGWNLLNICTLGLLGIFHIYPYQLTTHAAAYEYLRAQALNSGKLSWLDFGLVPPENWDN